MEGTEEVASTVTREVRLQNSVLLLLRFAGQVSKPCVFAELHVSSIYFCRTSVTFGEMSLQNFPPLSFCSLDVYHCRIFSRIACLWLFVPEHVPFLRNAVAERVLLLFSWWNICQWPRCFRRTRFNAIFIFVGRMSYLRKLSDREQSKGN